MPADLASPAAAVTADYMKIQYDHGALANPGYETMFEKHQQGIPGYSGGLVRYHGESKHLGCRSRHRVAPRGSESTPRFPGFTTSENPAAEARRSRPSSPRGSGSGGISLPGRCSYAQCTRGP
jgi:hypothetical protein